MHASALAGVFEAGYKQRWAHVCGAAGSQVIYSSFKAKKGRD